MTRHRRSSSIRPHGPPGHRLGAFRRGGRIGVALEPGELIARGRSVVRRLAGGGAHEAFVVTARDPHQRAVAKLPRPQLGDDPHCLLRLQTEGGHSSGSLIRCCRGISTPC